uniref:LAGLIDADG homing endonuclease n=1 Tax=Rhizoctonia solani TaxID=456999 RepID=A0A8E8GQY7_9AGAM|nr:LAGLIDADG homing endonuclease [Rhizoctonia solani]
MKIIFSLFNILATALFSLRISHLLAIVLLGIGALLYNVMYIQSIGSGLSSFGDLFNNFFFTKSSIGLEEISLLFFSLVPVVFYLINKLNKNRMKINCVMVNHHVYSQKREKKPLGFLQILRKFS